MKASRLRVGVDVPWVTSWSEETLIGPRPCPHAGFRMAVGQRQHAGFGRPFYSRNHHDRQRQSVAQMLCPMCGEPTEAGDRWMQTARRTTAGALRSRGLGAIAPSDLHDDQVVIDSGGIAPSHRACAELARDNCPHLQAHASPELVAFPERWWIAPLLVGSSNPAAPPLIGFLQLCGITSERDRSWRRS